MKAVNYTQCVPQKRRCRQTLSERADGSRGMISAEDCVQIQINCLNKCVNESDELMFKAVAKEEILHEGRTKTEIKQERSEEFNNKHLHSAHSIKHSLKTLDHGIG